MSQHENILFTEKLWEAWSSQEEKLYKITRDKSGNSQPKYLKKNYLHFDAKFWFPDRKEEIKKILQQGLKEYDRKNKTYNWRAFRPFLKILVKTPRYKYQSDISSFELETKIRPICFASHVDSLLFGFYSFAITKKYEDYISMPDSNIGECVLAYRSDLDGKCNIQFAKEVFELTKKRGQCSVIALDIKGYFDHIDHDILREKWCKVIRSEKLPPEQYKLFKEITQYSYVNKSSILKKYNVNINKIKNKPSSLLDVIPGKKDSEKYNRLREDRLIVKNNKSKKGTDRLAGIPQGSGMSALLSNIYLIDFDKDMYEKSKIENFVYRRYCDDILIICDSDKAKEIQEYTINKIKSDYKLTIQDKKVELTEFRQNSKGIIRAFNKKKMLEHGIDFTDGVSEQKFYKSLQYLGFEFNGQDIFIRSSSLSRYFRKLKGRIVKTVCMAYSSSSNPDVIWRKQLLHRYSHLGKRNFVRYAYNAAKSEYLNSNGELKIGMNSPAIKKQLGRHMDILSRNLEEKNIQRFLTKFNKNKPVNLKKTRMKPVETNL